MKLIYSDYEKIDLIMGAIAERAKTEATVGETFSCIIGEYYEMQYWLSLICFILDIFLFIWHE